jgi:hypothetical protein
MRKRRASWTLVGLVAAAATILPWVKFEVDTGTRPVENVSWSVLAQRCLGSTNSQRNWRPVVETADGPLQAITLRHTTNGRIDNVVSCLLTSRRSRAAVAASISGWWTQDAPANASSVTKTNAGGGYAQGSFVSASGPRDYYAVADGRVGHQVTRLTLILMTGQRVDAEIEDGWYLAWWSGTTSMPQSAIVNTRTGAHIQSMM